MHLYAYILCFFAFILNAESTTKLAPIHYTSYHIEWNDASQWSTAVNNDIISCSIQIPSLCIYAIPNHAGFQLFYNNSMFDFQADDQWNTIHIINIIDNKEQHTISPPRNEPKSRRKLLQSERTIAKELARSARQGARSSGRGIARAGRSLGRGGRRGARAAASSLKKLAKSKTAKALFLAWLAHKGMKQLGRSGGLSRLLGRRRRSRRFAGSYGCYNALCTTVLGPPRILGPPMPGRGLRGAASGLAHGLSHSLGRFANHIGPFSRCHNCGNSQYPGYMFMGPSSGMMSGMMYPMMGGMGGMGGMMGGMGGMMGGMHPMHQMGMNGMHPMHQMNGMGMNGMHPMQHMNGMGMNGMHPMNQMGMNQMSGMNNDAQNPLHIMVHEVKDKRRLIEDDGLNDVMKELSELLYDEYKIIQKCIAVESKDICVTYSYFDGSITLDYNIADDKSEHEGNNAKYSKISAWIWKIEEVHCNDEILWNNKGSLCVEYIDSEVVITLHKAKNSRKVIFDFTENTGSEIYDVEFRRNNEAIYKHKLCQSVLFRITNMKICVETLDDNIQDIQEMQISVEIMVDD